MFSLSFDPQKSDFKPYQGEHQKKKQSQQGIRSIDLVTTKLRDLYLYQNSIPIKPRSLTLPDIGIHNDNQDNENFDLILKLDDQIINQKNGNNYTVKDLLGVGTFGSVYKCTKNKQNYAIKIIKNINAFNLQSMKEIKLIRMLNKKCNHNSIIQLIDYFLFKNHVCIVFPLLGLNLEELLEETKYQGLSLNMIKNIIKQIVSGLDFIHQQNWVHCDIKPENILFTDNSAKQVQIIDFGSAQELNVNMFYYIQSLHYRAPEILLGYQKTQSIDMWSVGCVAAQLYLGYPLFQGSSSFDQLQKIFSTIKNNNNQQLIQNSKKCEEYFIKQNDHYQIKEFQQYVKEFNKDLPEPGPQNLSCIQELYLEYSKSSLRTIQEMATMDDFVDMLKRLLDIDPNMRITASQCLNHPFLRDIQFNIYDILKD